MQPPPYPSVLNAHPAPATAGASSCWHAGRGSAHLQLTREEEKKLLQRLESISSLVDLEHMQQRIHAFLGLEIRITPGNNEVRTMRGIQIGDLPGLCRKTRQSIPAAIRKGTGAGRDCLGPAGCA
jgi:hypothetical protein